MSEAEEIARKLSPAQKKALLWLPEDHNPRLAANWTGWHPRWNVMNRLVVMGLAERWHSLRVKRYAYSLSIGGCAVRGAVARAGGGE